MLRRVRLLFLKPVLQKFKVHLQVIFYGTISALVCRDLMESNLGKLSSSVDPRQSSRRGVGKTLDENLKTTHCIKSLPLLVYFSTTFSNFCRRCTNIFRDSQRNDNFFVKSRYALRNQQVRSKEYLNFNPLHFLTEIHLIKFTKNWLQLTKSVSLVKTTPQTVL